jgi:HSP20 family protein
MLTDSSAGEPAEKHKLKEESIMNGLVTRRLFPSEPRSIVRGFGSFHRDLDAIFDGVFGNRAVEAVADWAPHVETFVKDDALHVRADLPGVDPKDVDITAEDDLLTLRGERKAEHQEASYREITYGRFERRIRMPEGTDPEKISAKYTNGVLEITVPLTKPVARKVTVNVTNGGTA